RHTRLQGDWSSDVCSSDLGGGYPRNLKGAEIPLAARIFQIADTYDAIVSDRPYRKGQSPEAARSEIDKWTGVQFDPHVVEAFHRSEERRVGKECGYRGWPV